MEIQCPNCKSTQMTKGRIEFPCRKCGTLLKDPRVDSFEALGNRYVRLSEVLQIAKKNRIYNRMKEVLNLDYKELNNEC